MRMNFFYFIFLFFMNCLFLFLIHCPIRLTVLQICENCWYITMTFFLLHNKRTKCELAAFIVTSDPCFTTAYLPFTTGFENMLVSRADLNISYKGKTT